MPWFLCPYDQIDTGQKVLRFRRQPAIRRHIRFETKDAHWTEIETIGNHAAVEVTAPDDVLEAIRKDADFVEFDPADKQVARTLGFTNAEVNAAPDALTLMASARSVIGKNPAGTGLEVKAGRGPSAKGVSDANRTRP